jgi:putative pyruvate formate lyase activating enzyme
MRRLRFTQTPKPADEAQDYEPPYLKMAASGELADRVESLKAMLSSCTICARGCEVDRVAGEIGVCRAGADTVISSAFPHYGEEPPLVGWGGSGTIFLTHCNLRCVFCQNWEISHGGEGHVVSRGELVELMVRLQGMGCHNINFVTPSHFTPHLVEAIGEAAQRGLHLPIVWNCGGYESLDVIRLLEGIVDIYMPDVKFMEEEPAKVYLHAKDYPKVVKEVLKEMHRQVGDLDINSRGVACRGLLVRHLVMPNLLAGTAELVRFIAEEVSKNTYINIMEQYRPCYRAHEYPEISRRPTHGEFEDATGLARKAGLHRGF